MIPRVDPKRRAVVGALLVLAASAVHASGLRSQAPGPRVVRVGADRPVGPGSSHPEVEPHLSINPRKPSHLLAASMTVLTSDAATIDCTIFVSFDGGVGWSSATLRSLGYRAAGGCGDPWTAILPDGTALVSVLGDSGTVVVFRSADGGRTWSETRSVIRGGHDHEMMLADTVGGAVYLVSGAGSRNTRGEPRYAVFIARSGDGGRTFIERGRHVFSNLNYEAQTPVVLSDGTLVISYMDHRLPGGARLERRRVWVATSQDAGLTVTEPMLVSEACNRQGPAAWPTFAVAPPATEHADRLYFACEAHQNRGVVFARSADRGSRWTIAARADSVGAGAPMSDSAWTKVPALAVSASGAVALTWYDRRDDPRRQCQHLYATVSLDGGASFLPAARISEAPSCPDAGTNGGAAARFPGGGDYSGLVAVGPREFLAVWSDSRSGRFQLRVARFTVTDR